MRPHLPWLSKNCLALSAAAVLSTGVVAACTSSSSSSTTGATPTSSSSSSPSTKAPITVGASLSLTGDFSADGQAFDRGYKLSSNTSAMFMFMLRLSSCYGDLVQSR